MGLTERVRAVSQRPNVQTGGAVLFLLLGTGTAYLAATLAVFVVTFLRSGPWHDLIDVVILLMTPFIAAVALAFALIAGVALPLAWRVLSQLEERARWLLVLWALPVAAILLPLVL